MKHFFKNARKCKVLSLQGDTFHTEGRSVQKACNSHHVWEAPKRVTSIIGSQSQNIKNRNLVQWVIDSWWSCWRHCLFFFASGYSSLFFLQRWVWSLHRKLFSPNSHGRQDSVSRDSGNRTVWVPQNLGGTCMGTPVQKYCDLLRPSCLVALKRIPL